MALMEKAKEAKKYCSTNRSSSSVYEVVEFGCGYTVNLSTHQCACRKWDLTWIPCKHDVCVLDDNREHPMLDVAEYYYTHVLKKKYKDNIKPVNGEKLWINTNKPPIEKQQDMAGYHIVADVVKLDILTEDVTMNQLLLRDQRTGVVNLVSIQLSLHQSQGKNAQLKQTPNPLLQQAPKLSKQANQVHSLKLFQVLLSHHLVNHQSHMQKKAPRGKPLKIRKTGNIPHGVGTLWSPFTDRPFEVFGNYFYDRSTSNSQPPE
ncbi:unnamed protein product [Thlaspi arvense]|uniref:SWIM-type domain-containing protein n=1 Tax=Thlaspi arvense TaxID=13288 RepID=A0AAU9RZP4_THLAR|nr:unnamed protein product [Thlaspi arvense]